MSLHSLLYRTRTSAGALFVFLRRARIGVSNPLQAVAIFNSVSSIMPAGGWMRGRLLADGILISGVFLAKKSVMFFCFSMACAGEGSSSVRLAPVAGTPESVVLV